VAPVKPETAASSSILDESSPTGVRVATGVNGCPWHQMRWCSPTGSEISTQNWLCFSIKSILDHMHNTSRLQGVLRRPSGSAIGLWGGDGASVAPTGRQRVGSVLTPEAECAILDR